MTQSHRARILMRNLVPYLIDFQYARQAALKNTTKYLSVVNELDVYVATSMRTREDFSGNGSLLWRLVQ